MVDRVGWREEGMEMGVEFGLVRSERRTSGSVCAMQCVCCVIPTPHPWYTKIQDK